MNYQLKHCVICRKRFFIKDKEGKISKREIPGEKIKRRNVKTCSRECSTQRQTNLSSFKMRKERKEKKKITQKSRVKK